MDEYFNELRGVPYTIEEPNTDKGLGFWSEHDRKLREKREAVLGPEDAE